MSMRSFWQTAKADAKKANKNVEVKFPVSADLGPLLDKFEAAKKDFEKSGNGEKNAAWAKAAEVYVAAIAVAGAAAKTYLEALPHLTATKEAQALLHGRLAMGITDVLLKAGKDMERLKPLIVKAKAQK